MSTEAPTLPQSQSPFSAPARDNAGNPSPPLRSQTQQPDNRTAPAEGSFSRPSGTRSSISSEAFHNLSADDQARYSQVRTTDGNGTEWVPRADLEAASGTTTNGDGATVHKFGDMEFTEQELRDLMTAKADADLRKTNLPATPEDYRPDLPQGIELPAGIEVTIDLADPLLADARRLAKAKKWSQEDFSDLIGIYATAKANEARTLSLAHAAEVEKMGANGTMRVTALETWLRGVVGDKLAKPMRSMMVTADIVRGLELLQSKFSSQGAASFRQDGREVRTTGGVTDEQWGKMSSSERFAFAQSHDQSQFRRAG
jgi:hypothetical protein